MIADHRKDDHLATALASSQDTSQLVYFCLSESDDDRLFNFELEIAPANPKENRYDVEGHGARDKYKELLEIAREHLDDARPERRQESYPEDPREPACSVSQWPPPPAW